MLSDFLDGAHAVVVVEDGAIGFDLAESKYSVSGEYNKCLLHVWSSERNFVRRVLDAEVEGTRFRLQVQRMGQNRPTRLDFCRDRDPCSPAARRAARVAYEPRLHRALERNFPVSTVVRLTTSVDLEHSFGPAYMRGWLRQGQRAGGKLTFQCFSSASLVARGDKRCGRPAAAPRAKWFGHRPRGSGRRDRLFGRRRAAPSFAGPS